MVTLEAQLGESVDRHVLPISSHYGRVAESIKKTCLQTVKETELWLDETKIYIFGLQSKQYMCKKSVEDCCDCITLWECFSSGYTAILEEKGLCAEDVGTAFARHHIFSCVPRFSAGFNLIVD